MVTDIEKGMDARLPDSSLLWKNQPFQIIFNNGMHIEQGGPLTFILGPCVVESYDHSMRMAEAISEICIRQNTRFIFKSSFDKANRSSVDSFRGMGMFEGLKILDKVKHEFNVPVTTDVHETFQCDIVADVVDLLQIPAFLCRQTDLLIAAAETRLPVNVKKGQFVAPDDMKHVVEKIMSAHYSNNGQIILTERGTCFGYNNLVVDFRSLAIMRKFGTPICFDATHSTQLPGGGLQSGGQREFIPLLAKCAITAGVDLVFMEVHDNPEKALSDSACQLPLDWLESLICEMLALKDLVG